MPANVGKGIIDLLTAFVPGLANVVRGQRQGQTDNAMVNSNGGARPMPQMDSGPAPQQRPGGVQAINPQQVSTQQAANPFAGLAQMPGAQPMPQGMPAQDQPQQVQGQGGQGLAALAPMIAMLRQQQGGGGQPQGMPQGQPQGGQQMPQGMPQGQPQAQQRDPNMSATASPTGGNTIQDSQANIRSIISNIRASNPTASNSTIMRAAREQIAMMKGVEPQTRDMMNFQAHMLQQQTSLEEHANTIQKDLDIANGRAATAEKALAASEKRNQDSIAGRASNVDKQQTGAGQRSRDSIAGRASNVDKQQTGANARSANAEGGKDRRYQAKPDPTGNNAAKAGQSAYNNAISNGKSEAQAKTARSEAVSEYKSSAGGGSSGGGKPKPTPQDIAYLKAHPEAKAGFVQRFGAITS